MTQPANPQFIDVVDTPSLLAAFQNRNSGALHKHAALLNMTRELDVSRHAHQAPSRANAAVAYAFPWAAARRYSWMASTVSAATPRPICIHVAQGALTARIAQNFALCRCKVQPHSLAIVLRNTLTVLEHEAQVVLSDCMPLCRCKAPQSSSLCIVLRSAATRLKHSGQVDLRA
jgi:hypothetical protein